MSLNGLFKVDQIRQLSGGRFYNTSYLCNFLKKITNSTRYMYCSHDVHLYRLSVINVIANIVLIHKMSQLVSHVFFKDDVNLLKQEKH